MSKFKKKILVTAALPYANGPIHIGHVLEYVQADVFVRFLRLKNKEVIYICADDTHGTPIELNAKKQGIKPEELIAKYHKEHKKDFDDFLISFDNYYTSNSPENRHYSDFVFNKLKEEGHIYQKDLELAHCKKCKRFLPDRFVKGTCPKCGAEDQYGDVCEKCNAAYKTTDLKKPYCTICREKPERKKSNHYFFKLSDFSDKLKKWIAENDNLQKETKNFVLNWIKEGLEDWCISRDGPYFGFNIPGEKDKYYYVWLDAPISYIASADNYCKKKKCNVDDYLHGKDSSIIHFIGKDITYFHFLFWPAMLTGVGFNLPECINVHGFVTVNGEKMSKSRGTYLTARDYLKELNPEYLRFYYSANLSRTTGDIDLDYEDFKNKVNSDLVGNLANFAYRTLSFINSNFDSKIAGIASEKKIEKEIEKLFKEVEASYDNCNFREVIQKILEISAIGNKYFQEKEPWKLIKEDKKECSEVCGFAANIVKNLSILINPVLPAFAENVQKQLNVKNLSFDDLNFELKNHKINKAEIVLKKVEKDIFSVDEFPLNLKVAKITDVDDIEGADKLYKLQIDLGEKRQLVAGIKEFYKKDELKGRKIIVVSNMKPAKLRGVESNGMLLAAGKSDCVLLEAPKSKPGDVVTAGNLKNSEKQVTFDEFLKLKILIKDKKAVYQGNILKTEKEEISANIKDGTRVC